MIYKTQLPIDSGWTQQLAWCVEQFGSTEDYGNAWIKGVRWWRQGYALCFTNEQDYMLYLLRWS